MNDTKKKENFVKLKSFLSDYSVCLLLLLCAVSVFILAAVIAPHTISVDEESKISSTATSENDVKTDEEISRQSEAEAEEDGILLSENQSFKTIKDYEGRIAVFSANGKLERVTNILTSSLPEFDKEQIKTGIRVESEGELTALLDGLDS